MAVQGALVECFESLQDPRMVNKCRHKLLDILVIAVCATIASADSWDDIALFGESKAEWLRQWLELPNGIPSADTFQRVFAHLDGEAFQACFVKWVEKVFSLTEGQVLAIDGKSVRGTCDAQGQGGLYVVSAWATANQLTLAQVKVADKANEIVAIPDLLELLTVRGCIVTIDAMGCPKHILDTIRDQQGEYVVTVKGNQPTLQRTVPAAFEAADAQGWSQRPEAVVRPEETAHGRHEIRQCWVLSDCQVQALGWRDCHTLVRIQRTTSRGTAQKVSHETHYYISSLQADAATLLQTVREHWGIENRCHWVLDVVFHEDASRTRARFADDNLALLRKFALNFLRQHPAKGSLKGKRYQAALNEDFLVAVLKSSFNLMR
jgi:predicted transposase YbfD/YdcC